MSKTELVLGAIVFVVMMAILGYTLKVTEKPAEPPVISKRKFTKMRGGWPPEAQASPFIEFLDEANEPVTEPNL